MTVKPESYRMLVTGASGFVGTNLVRYFLRQGHSVIAVRGRAERSWRLEGAGATELDLDLTHHNAVKRAVREIAPHVIVHCAAYGAYSYQTETDRIYRVNVDSTRTLLEAARETEGFRCFIQAGSSSEYGFNCKAPAEDAMCWPDSDYSVSKIAAGALVRLYGKKHGVPAFNLRLYSVYGPFEDTSRLVMKVLMSVAQGRGLPPFANADISRDFVYIDDVSQAIDLVIEQAPQLVPGDTFNIGTGERTTIGDFVQAVRSGFGINTEPHWGSLPPRPWDHIDWYSDSTKAKKVLGWSARTTLNEGLALTMNWVKESSTLLDQALKSSVEVRP